MSIYLPAEWHPQHAIQLTWPHKDTDWARIIEKAHLFYIELATIILKFENLIICVPNETLKNELAQKLASTNFNCSIYICPSNDTWTRDHGPISVRINGQVQLQDFQFNGWGNKYRSDLDNQITSNLSKQQAYGSQKRSSIKFVLEGGSVESDGEGTLLTTKQCLLNKNRNPGYNENQICNLLTKQLGAKNILWLEHGDLIGDDTDAHIDTLARFAPNNLIIYQGCQDPNDEHCPGLLAMKNQLSTFKNRLGKPYTLIELPLPDAIFEDDFTPNIENQRQRLPASYANFLFINGAVLLPIYKVPQDLQAISIMKTALPDHEVIPIDCSILIRQYGSLHCITMQLPVPTPNGLT